MFFLIDHDYLSAHRTEDSGNDALDFYDRNKVKEEKQNKKLFTAYWFIIGCSSVCNFPVRISVFFSSFCCSISSVTLSNEYSHCHAVKRGYVY